MAADKQDIKGRVVVLTGASSGFGKGAARKLAERGASLVLAARRAELLEDLARECSAAGGDAIAVPTDVSDRGQMQALADQAVARFGRIDVWINDAGVAAIGRFEDIPLDHHEQVIRTNLIGVITGTYLAISQFRKQGGEGTVINVSSGLGKIPAPYYTSYVASKFGVVGLADAIRQELKLHDEDEKIRVCTVMPMAMDTHFFDHAANFTGKEPQPVGPLYDPELVVDKLVEMVTDPRDEAIVGRQGSMYNAMHHAFPGMIESVMAKRTRHDQFAGVPDAPADPGGVLMPESEGAGVRAGRLDD